MQQLDKENIYCFRGFYNGGSIITEEGEKYPAISYQIIWEKAKDKYGFFNIIWKEEINQWCLFQYVLEDIDQ